MKFQGTSRYVATDALKLAVNAAITLQRPLLIKGEPGTGKTLLAEELAGAIDAPLITWHVKSTTKAHQGLYEYDAVSRLRDSQLGDPRVEDIRHYIRRGKLWEAFTSERRAVLLIDEIDKADIEFPNDLLQELDRMEFYVYETDETIRAIHRPIILITSNNEKELPDASCAAASSTTSPSPTARRCSRSSPCTSPTSRSTWSTARWTCSSTCARCPA
jgi:MoxR-like ATPase